MKLKINDIDISKINDNSILSNYTVDILGMTYNVDAITNFYLANLNKKSHINHLINAAKQYQDLEDNCRFCYLSDIKLYHIKYLTKFLIRDGVLYTMLAKHFFAAFNIPYVKHKYKTSNMCTIIFTNSFFETHTIKDEYEEVFYKKLYGKDWQIIKRNKKLKEVMLLNNNE